MPGVSSAWLEARLHARQDACRHLEPRRANVGQASRLPRERASANEMTGPGSVSPPGQAGRLPYLRVHGEGARPSDLRARPLCWAVESAEPSSHSKGFGFSGALGGAAVALSTREIRFDRA